MAEKSLKRNAFYSILRTIMSLLFPLITFPYASRILLPEGTGKVNFANSIIGYFGMLASLGIGTYGIREAAKVRHDKRLLSQFTMELFIINLLSTLVAYILLYIAIIAVPKFHEYRMLLYMTSITILFTTMGISWFYSAVEEYGYIALRSVVFQVVSIVLLFSFVKKKEDYIIYASIGVVSSVGSNIFNLIHARKFISFSGIRKLELKKHLKPVFVLFGSSLAISVFTLLDTSMLGFLSTDVEVGYYSAATKLTRMIRDLFPAVFTVLFARLSIYAERTEDKERYESLVFNMLNFIICFALPIISGLFLLGKPILVLLSGVAFLPALPAMYVMVPVILFSATAGFLGGSVLNSLSKEKWYLYTVIAGAFINFTLNYLLIPHHGAFGAGVATVATELALMTCYVIQLRELIPFKKLAKPFGQSCFACIVMTAILYLIKDCLFSGFLQILMMTCIGITVYFFVLLLFKNYFVMQIIEIVKNKITRNKHDAV